MHTVCCIPHESETQWVPNFGLRKISKGDNIIIIISCSEFSQHVLLLIIYFTNRNKDASKSFYGITHLQSLIASGQNSLIGFSPLDIGIWI